MPNRTLDDLLQYDTLLAHPASPSETATVQEIGRLLRSFRDLTHVSVDGLAELLEVNPMLITIIEAGLGDSQTALGLLNACIHYSSTCTALSPEISYWQQAVQQILENQMLNRQPK